MADKDPALGVVARGIPHSSKPAIQVPGTGLFPTPPVGASRRVIARSARVKDVFMPCEAEIRTHLVDSHRTPNRKDLLEPLIPS